MFRSNWKTLLLGAVVAVTLFSAASQADAGWYWGYRPFYGGWGCCATPSYTACCDPCGDWCGSYGWARRPWGHRHWVGGWYSRCCNVCWVDPCCCVSSCCGDVVASPGAVVSPAPGGPAVSPPPPPPADAAPTPAKKPATPAAAAADVSPALPPEPSTPVAKPATGGLDSVLPPTTPEKKPAPSSGLEPAAPTPPAKPKANLFDGGSIGPTSENSGLLTIYVPAEAKVSINGLATRSTGSKRQYVSFGLQPGFTYKYEVKASIVRDGQLVEETRTATLTAGQRTAVAFGFNPHGTEGLAAN